ncbi:TPA: hypothetical protein N0F65_012958 [Lagenidium giganteum]|uniref:Uncharacterized protein n=1 Tax=Lagenidium giganteum TaxID=4803 RepID=A0AAV2Z196_9STRA|nr:TPA: hypothetical protein N0F65_012958 [Lagenidium giganteum]
MSFSRIWHAINTRGEGEFPLHRFVWYFRGEHRYHWKFCIENVEIGSGSHENKVEAFRAACADAMEFLLSLKLYPENGWHERRSTGKNEREKKTESGRNGRDDKSPNRSVSKPSLRSSVEKDHASTGNLRDTRSGLAREGGRASTPSRTADVEDMSMSEQGKIVQCWVTDCMLTSVACRQSMIRTVRRVQQPHVVVSATRVRCARSEDRSWGNASSADGRAIRLARSTRVLSARCWICCRMASPANGKAKSRAFGIKCPYLFKHTKQPRKLQETGRRFSSVQHWSSRCDI